MNAIKSIILVALAGISVSTLSGCTVYTTSYSGDYYYPGYSYYYSTYPYSYYEPSYYTRSYYTVRVRHYD